MGDNTTIEWTDATWNPVRGCAIVSKGCTNCYAMRQARRASGPGRAYDGLTKLTKGGPVWTGKIRLVPELLEQPLAWQRPRRIFVNSMSDLFHEDVPVEFIYRLWCVMAAARRHRFQILTKRAARMREVLTGPTFRSQVLDNVWLGVSVEDQVAADERIPQLLETPAALRWISAEPLLGELALMRYLRVARGPAPQPQGLDWVVVGGESGPGARPMLPEWVRTIRNHCEFTATPFFFKQWGSFLPGELVQGDPVLRWQDGATEYFGDHQDIKYQADKYRCSGDAHRYIICRPTPKKAAGRELDGRTHDEYPA